MKPRNRHVSYSSNIGAPFHHQYLAPQNKLKMASDIHEFKIDIPPEEVDRLKRKLNDTRLPGREIVPGAGS
ncbi:hypothetical protein BJX99DRAFT_222241 [Aspergillus californicus]